MNKDIQKWLDDNNWKEGKILKHDKHTKLWYKRFNTVEPRCYGNSDKPGIVIGIKYWDFRVHNHDHESFEIELIAETKNEEWINFRFYSVPVSQFLKKVDEMIECLINSWISVENTMQEKNYEMCNS